ncbi:MAG: amidohydrolase family protein [Candidatus Aenigmatarchaeota archaeon]|nr:MAG: amidohydrolase family protein [Candidatus Aenigmarchaeota archaeon]
MKPFILLAIVFIAGCVASSELPPLAASEEGGTGPSGESTPDTTQDVDSINETEAEEPLSYEETVWKERVDAALEPASCPALRKKTYPEGYYKGPLIDTHLHIPSIPTSPPGEEDEEEDQFPRLGVNVKVADVVCTLKHENTKSAFVFFPVSRDEYEISVEVVNRTMRTYDVFVPFIMPPDDDGSPTGYPTVDADKLEKMIGVYPELFEGYGEIGLYERRGGAAELPPDSERLTNIYPIVREHELAVYFHPGEDQEESLERVLDAYPDVNFIVHGEQIEDEIAGLMSRHDNVYFTVNDLYGDQYLLHPGEDVDSFLAATDEYEPLLEKDLGTWKSRIEAHPDQFVWGTDRGGIAVWTFDKAVGERLNDYGRAFIGRLNPDVQEKFAYRNAERIVEGR